MMSRLEVKLGSTLKRTSAATCAMGLLAVALAMDSAHGAPGDPPAASKSKPTPSETELNAQLEVTLRKAGFTGKVESTLENRLGRKLNPALVEVGRNLFFDPIGALGNDNSCAGCHAPANAMGDSQSIAIGVLNNNLVGPDRKGPRNQRRTPSVVNTAFYPSLMWNGRFSAPSGNPFDNSAGFAFPAPEGSTKFPPNSPSIRHLLVAQAHIPPTELSEAAGFKGTKGEIDARLDKFDTGKGSPVPKPDASGFRNEPIRVEVMKRLNDNKEYVKMFGKIFPEVQHGSPITAVMFGQAIAEFEFSLVRANAPIDKFARGNHDAMIPKGKRGALLFFGKANCVACHAVAGQSNEMFSDFKNHVAGVPQIAPKLGTANVIYDGPGEDEDFGLEQFTGNAADRYKFRTSPLRNVGLQPTFFHNGAFTDLEEAIRFHINTPAVARKYNAKDAGVDKDLTHRQGPMEPVLQRLDPRLSQPVRLTDDEISDLLRFVRVSLTDRGANADELCKLVPKTLPSGLKPLEFQECN